MQILIALMIAIQAQQPSVGYLVVESNAFEIKLLKTTEKHLVDSIASAYHVNADSLLHESNFFQVRTDWKKLYVEKKRIVVKKGKLKYKRWQNY